MSGKSFIKEENGKNMYIIEAALEYLISIPVAGSFLAAVTKSLGFSDGMTGIISAMISLGCLFQLFSIAISRKNVKRTVVVLSVANQVLFTVLYLIPLSGLSKSIKLTLFVICIFAAYFIYNIIHPLKINWLMSLVEEGKRGIFTATKERISLVFGMAFSFCMGAVSDKYLDSKNQNIGFIIFAAVMLVITLLHTAVLFVTPETEGDSGNNAQRLRELPSRVFANKQILPVTLTFVIYYISKDISLPFYGSYQIGELSFSLKFVSLLTIISSVVRILASGFWGRYADKKSFSVMFQKCLLLIALSQTAVIFAVPENGKIMFTIYYILHGIAMGGANSALINLVFDYVPPSLRTDSLAICQAFSGLAGFLSTIAVSPLVDIVQKNGNMLFGIHLYAQQGITVLSVVLTLLTVLFIRKTPKLQHS